MAKPPASPPSTDIKDKAGPPPPKREQSAEGEEHARKEGKGRPPQSTR